MPCPALVLRLFDRPYRGILRRAQRALDRLDALAFGRVEAALVEGVFAHEVHDGLVNGVAAGGTARRGEDGRLGADFFELGTFGGRVGAEGGDHAAVLGKGVLLVLDH